MLCWAHSALIGQQLSASHVLLQLSNLCQAFSKKFKVLNTRAFSLLPGMSTLKNIYYFDPSHSSVAPTNLMSEVKFFVNLNGFNLDIVQNFPLNTLRHITLPPLHTAVSSAGSTTKIWSCVPGHTTDMKLGHKSS